MTAARNRIFTQTPPGIGRPDPDDRAAPPLDALAVAVSRVLLSGFLFGNLTSLAYALSGALLSLAGMCLLRRAPVFSVVGVSAAGGCLHNAAQLAVAALTVHGSGIGVYLPVLVIAGTLTGAVNGLVAGQLLARLGGVLPGQVRK